MKVKCFLTAYIHYNTILYKIHRICGKKWKSWHYFRKVVQCNTL